MVRCGDGLNAPLHIIARFPSLPKRDRFQKGQDLEGPTGLLTITNRGPATDVGGRRVKFPSAAGQELMGADVTIHCQSNLFEIICARHPSTAFPRRLNGGQEQPHQDPDNRDDHE